MAQPKKTAQAERKQSGTQEASRECQPGPPEHAKQRNNRRWQRGATRERATTQTRDRGQETRASEGFSNPKSGPRRKVQTQLKEQDRDTHDDTESVMKTRTGNVEGDFGSNQGAQARKTEEDKRLKETGAIQHSGHLGDIHHSHSSAPPGKPQRTERQYKE
mgnify:CR=1 FL=1